MAILIKSKDIIDTPKKTLIKSNVIDRVNCSLNKIVREENGSRISKSAKVFYNYDIASTLMFTPSRAAFMVYKPIEADYFWVQTTYDESGDYSYRAVREYSALEITLESKLGFYEYQDKTIFENVTINKKLRHLSYWIDTVSYIGPVSDYKYQGMPGDTYELEAREVFTPDKKYTYLNCTSTSINGLQNAELNYAYKTLIIDGVTYHLDDDESIKQLITKSNYSPSMLLVTEYTFAKIKLLYLCPSIFYIKNNYKTDLENNKQPQIRNINLTTKEQQKYWPDKYDMTHFMTLDSFSVDFSFDKYNLEPTTISYGSGQHGYELENNELMQIGELEETNENFENLAQRIINKYSNGKKAIEFSCRLNDYYNENNFLIYEKNKGEFFNVGDIIKVYINKRGQEILFSESNFMITSVKFDYSTSETKIEIEAEETNLT